MKASTSLVQNPSSEGSNPKVIDAVNWLRGQEKPVPNVIQTLRKNFDLSALEACQACALARNGGNA